MRKSIENKLLKARTVIEIQPRAKPQVNTETEIYVTKEFYQNTMQYSCDSI